MTVPMGIARKRADRGTTDADLPGTSSAGWGSWGGDCVTLIIPLVVGSIPHPPPIVSDLCW